MLRLTALILALTAATSITATAQDYSDQANNFRVAIPNGWTSATPSSPIIKIVMSSPRVADTHGNCNVITKAVAETKGTSQADIDAQLDSGIDDTFWLTGFKQAKYVDDASIEGSGARMRNGHKTYFAVANLSATLPNVGQIKAKTQQMLEGIPGQLFLVTCTASDTGYAQEESDFNTVFDSFAPLSDTPVASAAPSGVSSLTLYSLAHFGGVSRVVTQDTPDFALAGWRNETASISVGGGRIWQVCDGPNYSGTCHVVSGALPKAFSAEIVSARHYVPRRGDLSAIARLMQSGGAEAATAALAHRH